MSYANALELLEGLRGLPAGWNSYNAKPIADAAIERARAFLGVLERHGVRCPTVGPDVSGGVALLWMPGGREVWAEIGAELVTWDERDQVDVDVDETWESMDEAVEWIRGRIT